MSLVPIPLCWLSSEHLAGPWECGLGCICTHLSGMWNVCIEGLISPLTAWVDGLWIHPFTPTLSTSLESSRKAIWLHRKQKWNYLSNLHPVHGYVGRIQRRLGWNLVVVVHFCSPSLLGIWLKETRQELWNHLFSLKKCFPTSGGCFLGFSPEIGR